MSYNEYVEAAKREPSSEIKTPQFDPRFPNSNVTKWCFVSYCDYHRCNKVLDNDPKCEYFKDVVKSICPNAWVEKWDDLRDQGIFAGEAYINRPRKEKKISEEDNTTGISNNGENKNGENNNVQNNNGENNNGEKKEA